MNPLFDICRRITTLYTLCNKEAGSFTGHSLFTFTILKVANSLLTYFLPMEMKGMHLYTYIILYLVKERIFAYSYLNTVQTTCPHILRYITAAAIISKRRKNIMKDLVKIIQQVRYMT